MNQQTPTLADLRALVRGELPARAALEVDRWLVRHPHPRVTAYLDFLVDEMQEEAADERVADWPQRLGQVFLSKLREGLAAVDEVLDPGLPLPALACQPRDLVEGVRLMAGAEGPERSLEVHLTVGAGRASAVMVATCDSGAVNVLLPRRWEEPLSHGVTLQAGWTREADEGRVTFWGLVGDAHLELPPAAPADHGGWLERALADPAVTVFASRVSPPEES